jgi:hypothetical protein
MGCPRLVRRVRAPAVEETNTVFRRSKKIRDSLTNTRRSFYVQISGLLAGGDITEDTWEDLEAFKQ